MADLGDQIGWPLLLAGPPDCYVLPCTKVEYDDSVWAARARTTKWHKEEERYWARHEGFSDIRSVPSGVQHITRLISRANGDDGAKEWRPGGYWVSWWNNLIHGRGICEWKPCADPMIQGLLICSRGAA